MVNCPACLVEEPVVQEEKSLKNVSLPGLCGGERERGRCTGTCLTIRGVVAVGCKKHNHDG